MDDFKYLSSTIQSKGLCTREEKKRASGLIRDRKIAARVKEKVHKMVARPGLKTVAVTKRQE